MTTRDAVLSSNIEGNKATMVEVLEYEVAGAGQSIDPSKEADIEEVLNYRKALRQAEEMFKSLPLCNRLIKQLHETLLSGGARPRPGTGQVSDRPELYRAARSAHRKRPARPDCSRLW